MQATAEQTAATVKVPSVPFIPKGAYLVVIPKEERDITAGGIHIPQMAKNPLNQGTVLATGPDVQSVEVGEEIIWALHMETRIQFDREWIYFLQESDVIAKMASNWQPELKIRK